MRDKESTKIPTVLELCAVYGAVASAGFKPQNVHTAAHTHSNAAATVQLVSKHHEKLNDMSGFASACPKQRIVARELAA